MRQLLVLCAVLTFPIVAFAAPPAPPAKAAATGIVTKAEALVDALAKGDYQAATKDFDATMKNALPAAKLADTWKQIQAQAGAYKGRGASRQDKEQGYDIVYVACRFEKVPLDAKVVFDSQQKVAGLFFQPAR